MHNIIHTHISHTTNTNTKIQNTLFINPTTNVQIKYITYTHMEHTTNINHVTNKIHKHNINKTHTHYTQINILHTIQKITNTAHHIHTIHHSTHYTLHTKYIHHTNTHTLHTYILNKHYI